MTREEVEQEMVSLWGVKVPERHTAVMLKSVLQELRAQEGGATDKPKALPTRKAELTALAGTKGVDLSGNETCAQIQRKLLAKAEEEEGDRVEAKVMGIGKHKGKDYEEIYKADKSYCEWALITVIENGKGSHPQLRHFAQWIDNKETGAIQRATEKFVEKKSEKKKVVEHYIGEDMEKEEMKLKMRTMEEQILLLQQASSSKSDDPMAGRKRMTPTKSSFSDPASEAQEEYEVVSRIQQLTPRSKKTVEELLMRK
jgi:hypothetical protein